jgi:large subunit ribosomal protein L25
MLELAVTARTAKEDPKALRASGKIPAVFYGPKEASTPIAVDAVIFDKLWHSAGESTIVTLTGMGTKKDTLIHAVDVHPVSGAIQHADFYVIEAGKLLEVSIPIEFEGISPAEKVGGVVVKVLHEIPIKVAPGELPQHFTVDISKLENIGDHITVGDIKLPPSATLEIDAHETVVSITEAKEEEPEPVVATEGDAAAAPVEGGAAPEATA